MNTPDVIYLVYVNSDTTEGRGPMIQAHNSGFFFSEDAAWEFADTLGGLMGRRPEGGSWRDGNMGDVTVRKFYRHNAKDMLRKAEIMTQLENLRKELKELA